MTPNSQLMLSHVLHVFINLSWDSLHLEKPCAAKILLLVWHRLSNIICEEKSLKAADDKSIVGASHVRIRIQILIRIRILGFLSWIREKSGGFETTGVDSDSSQKRWIWIWNGVQIRTSLVGAIPIEGLAGQ